MKSFLSFLFLFGFVLGVTELTAEDTKSPASNKLGKVIPDSDGDRLERELKTPFQIAALNPVQLFSSGRAVSGLRVNLLYGKNTDVKGVDLGLINYSTKDFSGIGFGILNWVEKNGVGLQLGVVNNSRGHFSGIQSAALFSVTEGDFSGLQGAFHASTKGNFRGWQGSTGCSLCEGDFYGIQTSWLFNIVKGKCNGAQVGLVNIADSLNGVQVGLINVNSKGPLTAFPIINIGF